MTVGSRIEWTDATWNPIVGCTKVSEGCRNCYAIRLARRMDGQGIGYDGTTIEGPNWSGKVNLLPERLDQPLRWRKSRRVFVNSMSDLFHPSVPDEFVARVFAVMARARQHQFQVLTKRPERMAALVPRLPEIWAKAARKAPEDFITYPWPLPGVWLGTSVEDQATANERIPHLLQTPAAVRFLSCEPLLGPVDLLDTPTGNALDSCNDCEEGTCESCVVLGKINWVIVGGESGPGARPMHPDWVRELRDQCVGAGTAFFFKQWGEYFPFDWGEDCFRGTFVHDGSLQDLVEVKHRGRFVTMLRAGKGKTGRILDGRTWDEYPVYSNGVFHG